MTDGVKVVCIVKHSAGHSESTSIQVPFGTKTNVMSAPQVVASSITFASRYAFKNAFGIMTGDEDNDANFKVDDEEKNNQQKILNKASADLKKTVKKGWNSLLRSWTRRILLR